MNASLVFEKFVQAIKSHRLLERGDRVIVAVSGGADSVALLSLLLGVREQYALDLIVAHLNHNLRGESSDGDEEFVRHLAKRLGTEFISEKISAGEVAARRGSLENWARKRRYGFLSKAAATACAQRVAVGHTMSDQAETLLMRLLRGSGTLGLSAMPYQSGLFIRPLLSIERREVVEYLEVRGIAWREDASNQDTQFLRNRLRQEMIPNLRDRYNPRIVPLLAGTAAILREETEALQFYASEVFDREAVVAGQRVIWDLKKLLSFPVGLQKRLIRHSLAMLTQGRLGMSFHDVASIVNLLREGKSGKSFQTGRFRCFREFNHLVLEVPAPRGEPDKFRYTLRIPGQIDLAETGTRFEARLDPPSDDRDALNQWELFLSGAELEVGFLIRNWEPADVYFPPGASSPKQVVEMFAQRRIPRRCRASWPVVVLAGRVVCVRDFPFSTENTVASRTRSGNRVVVEERSQDR